MATTGIGEDVVGVVASKANGGSQNTPPARSDADIRELDEHELKASLKSAWKKVDRVGSKEMGPLLYWLRERLRAQGARNDIIKDKDRGFSAWVEDNLEISRATAHRWANEYAYANGLASKPTSSQTRRSAGGLLERGKPIQFTYWATPAMHKQYQQSVEILKTHFKLSDDKEATLRGAIYAAQIITDQSRTGKGSKTGTGRRTR